MTVSKNSIMLINGKYFDYKKPDMSVLDVEVLAHGLALTNRFSGQTYEPYSVAQHSYYVSLLCDPEVAKEGLFHDASEVPLRDVSRPAKSLLPCYTKMEDHFTPLIYERFGIPFPEGGMSSSVHEADMRICLTEARDLCHPKEWKNWPIDVRPYTDMWIRPWSWKVAKEAFISRCKELEIE